MAAQSGLDFEGTFNALITGLYIDNTTNAISEADLRALVTAIRESYLNRIDDAYTGAFPRVDISGTTAYTGTLSPAITAYTNGMKVHVKAKDTSTGGVTLNLNAVGVKQVWKNPTTQAGANDLLDEQGYILEYDSALNGAAGVFLMITGVSSGTVTSVTGTTNRITSTGGATPVIDIDAAYDTAVTNAIAAAISTEVTNRNAAIASKIIYESIQITDDVSPISASTTVPKKTFYMPVGRTVDSLLCSLTTAQASGSIFTVDIHIDGTTVLSTKLTIDNTENTSLSPVTAYVLTDNTWTQGQKAEVFVDQVGNGSAVELIMYIGWH